MNTIEIPVSAKCGIFSECIVTLGLASGKNVTVIADSSLIRSDEGQQYLRVYVVDSPSETLAEIKVLLPTEAIEIETRWVTVANPALQVA